MHFFRNIYFGFRAYWRAIQFIKEHKLYWYILIPAVLMLAIYKVGEKIQFHEVAIQTETMNDIVWSMLHMLFEISIALLLMKFAKYLVVILLSPLLSFLSQKCEKILTGKSYSFDFNQLFRDVKRGLQIATRNIMWEYFFFLIIYIAAFIGWDEPQKAPIFYLTFVIGFFYYGFSFIDYVNERLRLNVDESILFVRKHRGLAIAIGSIYSILILVPVDLGVLFTTKAFENGFLNGLGTYLFHLFLWICASCAPILAIVASTLAMNDIVNLKNNIYSQK
jgi:CysZ protein